MPVFAGIDIGAAGALATRTVAGRAHDDVGVAVVVDVAHARYVLSKVIGAFLG